MTRAVLTCQLPQLWGITTGVPDIQFENESCHDMVEEVYFHKKIKQIEYKL